MNNEILLPNRCHEWLQSLKNPVFTGFFQAVKSFPLNRSRGLRCQVIEHTVDSLDLGGDAGGDLL